MASNDALRRNRNVRNLVIDYALGAAILGLNPFRNLLTLTLLFAAMLLFKMMWDIRVQWEFQSKARTHRIISAAFRIMGAIGVALLVWGSVIALVFLIPVNSLAIATALFTLFWIVGMGTNQDYLNRHPINTVVDLSEGA